MTKPIRKRLPGEGEVRNLINKDDHAECPCCGAVWRQGRPWTATIYTVAQMAELRGVSRSSITQKLARGTMAGYQNLKGEWLIPIV